MNRAIIIEIRKPGKGEETLYGRTYIDPAIAKIFINGRMNHKYRDLVNTFFHEMAHVWFGLFHDKPIDKRLEEDICWRLGDVCEAILRREDIHV